jgi:hypothetical protein
LKIQFYFCICFWLAYDYFDHNASSERISIYIIAQTHKKINSFSLKMKQKTTSGSTNGLTSNKSLFLLLLLPVIYINKRQKSGISIVIGRRNDNVTDKRYAADNEKHYGPDEPSGIVRLAFQLC